MICKHKSTHLNSSKFTNNSIKHQKYVYTQLNEQKVLFQTIQYRVSQSQWLQVLLCITKISPFCESSLFFLLYGLERLNINHL